MLDSGVSHRHRFESIFSFFSDAKGITVFIHRFLVLQVHFSIALKWWLTSFEPGDHVRLNCVLCSRISIHHSLIASRRRIFRFLSFNCWPLVLCNRSRIWPSDAEYHEQDEIKCNLFSVLDFNEILKRLEAHAINTFHPINGLRFIFHWNHFRHAWVCGAALKEIDKCSEVFGGHCVNRVATGVTPNKRF